jgi:hypothetical protein
MGEYSKLRESLRDYRREKLDKRDPDFLPFFPALEVQWYCRMMSQFDITLTRVRVDLELALSWLRLADIQPGNWLT